MTPGLPPGMTRAQLTRAKQCPKSCKQDMIQCLFPNMPGPLPRTMYSRCLMCLTYWETDSAGRIVKLTAPMSIEICPDCVRPMDQAADKLLGLPGNLCKNPGHAASKLLKEI